MDRHTTEAELKAHESRVRRLAKRKGYRFRTLNTVGFHYGLVNPNTGKTVATWDYRATLADVEEWLRHVLEDVPECQDDRLTIQDDRRTTEEVERLQARGVLMMYRPH